MTHHDVDPVETLRAELSRVEVSPEFAERVRRQIGQDAIASIRQDAIASIGQDAIASIGAELSELSVSPEFAVRVRQQIEDAPARSRWFGAFTWRWAVPVAAAAAVVVAILSMRDGAQKTTGVETAGVQASGSAPQASPVTTPSSIAPSAPVTEPPKIARARVTQRTATAAAASGQQAEDTLEVITNQPAILRQLWAAAAVTTVVQISDVPEEVRAIAISPVEVTPVAVQWLVEPPQSGGVAPIIRRVSADAERSDK